MPVCNPFPERQDNTFRLLANADVFLPTMVTAIRQAKRYVLFEQYLIHSGDLANRFINALSNCVQRGVPVYMLIDHFGARNLSTMDRQHLRDVGVHLVFYNPAYLSHFFRGLPRNHCKVLLIDGEVAYTGGVGIADEYAPKNTDQPWHDLIVEMKGAIVTDWQTQFMQLWQRWDDNLELPAIEHSTHQGQQSGRLAVSLRGRKKFIRQELLAQIRTASDRVWLGTAYYLPGRRMLRALHSAKKRGVDVRLLLPGEINDHPAVYHAGRRYYHYMLRSGIRIFEYQPAFMHAKLYLCDHWCSVGSCNMDRWGLRWNLEANLESSDKNLCKELQSFFLDAFVDSHEITLDAWHKRPLKHRVREWLFGYLDLMIERFGIYQSLKKDALKEPVHPPRP